MCLAIPGQVIEIWPVEGSFVSGRVDFGGVKREICFDLVPEVKVGDYVIVHAGTALSILDEGEAEKTLQMLREMAAGFSGEEDL
jgi:hydrogenase expression/formation protein HypC